jgi:hypothetical protein
MLAEFSTLVGTLKRKMPAIESGILFNEPTRLQMENKSLDVPKIDSNNDIKD